MSDPIIITAIVTMSLSVIVSLIYYFWPSSVEREKEEKRAYYSSITESVISQTEIYEKTIGYENIMIAVTMQEFDKAINQTVFFIVSDMVEKGVILVDDPDLIQLIGAKVRKQLIENTPVVIAKKKLLGDRMEEGELINKLLRAIQEKAETETGKKTESRGIKDIYGGLRK